MTWPLFQRQPRQIGQYEVLAKIGKGSAGSVFKARHENTGAVVAIKVLCAEDASDNVSLIRFEQEFITSFHLNDPHIVRGLEFGHQGNVPYLVMEFVEGMSLTRHLKVVGRMAESDAVRIIVQVAQALDHAHQRGLVHRDVKPDNILVSADGQAKLTDFGLVKCLESGLNLTCAGDSLGTPCYMAPEQFGDADRVDLRCDVYGLAATLYKAVTGEAPFNAKGYAITVRKKLTGDLEAPRQLVPQLSLQIDAAIMRALSVDPSMRQASCTEFARDLIGKGLQTLEDSGLIVGYTDASDAAARERKAAERRAAIRYPCKHEGLCSAVGVSGQGSWDVEVRNISGTGIGLVLDRRFERGTVLALQWRQTIEEVIGTTVARVVRTQEQGPGQWLLGCQLARKLDDEDLGILLAHGD
jgi:serine/threonine protein kinase